MRVNGAAIDAPDLALLSRHAQQLTETWQAQIVRATTGKMRAVILAMLAHSYFKGMDALLRVVDPGFTKLEPPLFSGPAAIVKTGQVVCVLIDRNMKAHKGQTVFNSHDDMVWEFRRLADRLKLTDAQRTDMFSAIARWVTADYRIRESVEAQADA